MSNVTNFIRTLDSKVWHGIEKVALKHPSGSKTLAIPVALGTFVRDVFAAPAKCIEELILTGKSIKGYVVEKDEKMFFWRKNDIEIHLIGTMKNLFMTPFSPLVGLIDAIVSLVKMLDSPLKTAKINAAKQDFVTFVEQSKYIKLESYTNNELINFASQYEFANSIFNRFQQAVKSAKDLESISQIHFVNEENAKKSIVDEIELKNKKFNEASEVNINKYSELLKSDSYQKLDKKSQEACIKKFNDEWRKFQQKLIDVSDPIEIDNLSFNPVLSC